MSSQESDMSASLQSWNREQLESFAKYLNDCNVPIPQAVTILIDLARKKEEEEIARKNANQKDANTTSRTREEDLLNDLTATYTKLREEVLILSHLPDPVIAVGVNGTIKFCNVQLEKALNHNLEDLVGLNIEDIIVPGSTGRMRRLIQDLIASDGGAGEAGERVDVKGTNGTVKQKKITKRNSSDPQSAKQSFLLSEVDLGANDAKIAAGNASDSSSEPPSGKEESSFTYKSSSLTEDNDSSDDFADDEYSVGKGKIHPLAPACFIRMIRKDLTTVHCEVTGSICTHAFDDEAVEKPTGTSAKATQKQETDIFLCLRLTREGRKMKEEVHFQEGNGETVNATCKRPFSDSAEIISRKKEAKGLSSRVVGTNRSDEDTAVS